MSKFFYKSATGVNNDIARHNAHQKELEDKIAELEQIANPTLADYTFLRAYNHLLSQLLESKAEAVSKLGKR